jgi:outer membrane protein insertion porin family
MNRLLPIICILVSLTRGGARDTHTMAQTPPQLTSAEIKPCDASSAKGKPTLKRRQPIQNIPTADQDSNDREPSENQECTHKLSEGESFKDQNRVRIEFEGLHAFSESDVLRAFSEEHVLVSRDRLPGANAIDKAATVLKNLLRTHGYMYATVSGLRVEGARTVKFVVDEGIRLSIAELLFEGNRIFSSEELAASLRRCLADYSEHTELGLDSNVLDVCQRRLVNSIRSRGYLQAKLGEPRIVITTKGLAITVPVDEGVLYRLGNIKIEGAQALTPGEVRAKFSAQEGDVADSDWIAKWLFEDLKSMYGEMGFIQYMAEPIPTFKSNPRNDKEGIVDLVVFIEEGKRFTLRSLTFIGETLSEEELSELSLIQVGDLFNQHLFEESIKRLNESERFEPLDKDKDTDFRTDEEEGTVRIVIKLRKRALLQVSR